MKPIDIGLIQARRKKLEEEAKAELARHERAMAALQMEADELEIAEKVFSRLSRGDDEDDDVEVAADDESPLDTNEQKSAGKPEGLPPVTEMIKEALGHSIALGAPGLKPAGILSYVRGKWWPEAEPNDVGPIAWRMWQNEQLLKYKKSGEYTLLEEEAKAVRERAASERAAAKVVFGEAQTAPSIIRRI